jgi:hypothetical protein
VTSPFAGQRFGLVTMHDKHRVIAPALRARLGVDVGVVDDVDTDRLGTFTREIDRAGSQIDAARAKAELALERGYAVGLGSEGALVPGPFGLGTTDVECIVCLEAATGLFVVGRAVEPGLHVHGVVSSIEALMAFAVRAGFPSHGLVIRPSDLDGSGLHKGLCTTEALHEAFFVAQRASTDGRVHVESDLRAHQHPTRMTTIAAAAADLADRLACRCASCGAPGFGFARRVPGRLCRDCGAPTSEPIADEYACVRCDHVELRASGNDDFADPGRCDFCNP